ncbi:MAG TPA: hypothetical protein VN922_22535 [Bacteroidia bacterium]|nr:hypothetical protein [Bacteroidia bacterium]
MRLTTDRKWLFAILPLLYISLAVLFLTGIKQFYIGNFDPEYAYLLNGTNIASGHFRVGNIEHPGTPIDCFAAIVIFIKHLFSTNTVLYQDVLLHPESYLLACSISLTILLALATFWAGVYIYRSSGNIILALLFQASPLFYCDTLKMAICLNTESGITIFGILFAAYLYAATVGNNKQEQTPTNRNVIVFGLFTALLVTTKIYCVPIILLVFFVLEKTLQRVIYISATGAFSAILLFPLYNQLRNWAGWIKSLIIHSGSYGQGKNGFLDPSVYFTNITDILSYNILFTLVFIIVVVAFLIVLIQKLKKKSSTSIYTSSIIGIIGFFISFMLIIAKQYKVIYPDPLTHRTLVILKFYYFIPLFIFFPFIISVVYKIIAPFTVHGSLQSYKHRLFLLAILILIGWGGLQSFNACNEAKNQGIAFDKTRQFLSSYKNSPLIIVTDGDKVCPEVALFLGISYSGKWDQPVYKDFIEKTYPNSYLYTTWNDQLVSWTQKTDISGILSKNTSALIYFSDGNDTIISNTILRRICEYPGQANKLGYKKIYGSENKYENIYCIQPIIQP